MNSQSRRLKPWLRAVAIVTAIAVTTTSVADANQLNLPDPKMAVTDSLPQMTVGLLDNIDLPSSIGTVKRIYRGSRSGVVVHIQDAHVNEEAQRNIGRIIQYFSKNKGLNLVNLEGGSGELATGLFSFFPDKNVRKEVSDYYLREGRLSGAEYLAVVEEPTLKLNGIEDPELYQQNKAAYLDALSFKERDQKVLDQLKSILNKVSRHVFSKELYELTRQRGQFQEDGKNLLSYVRYLIDLAEGKQVATDDYQGIHNLITMMDLEKKIDFEKAEKEIAPLGDDLKSFLSADQLTRYLANSVQYDHKKMSRHDYYHFLEVQLKNLSEAAQGENLVIKYANLIKYLRYIQLYDTINVEVFDEIEGLENSLKSKLFQSEEEKQLDTLIRAHLILEKIFDFSLTKQDADYFYAHRDQFESAKFKETLEPLLAKYRFTIGLPMDLDVLDQDLPRIEKFYQFALQRDHVLIQNTVDKMESEETDISAVVTGGFHTAGIERYLAEHDYSYIVIAPNISSGMDSKKDADRYQAALSKKPLPVEQALALALPSTKSARVNDPRFQLAVELLLYIDMARGAKSFDNNPSAEAYWRLMALAMVGKFGSLVEATAALTEALKNVSVQDERNLLEALIEQLLNAKYIEVKDQKKYGVPRIQQIYFQNGEKYIVFEITPADADVSEIAQRVGTSALMDTFIYGEQKVAIYQLDASVVDQEFDKKLAPEISIPLAKAIETEAITSLELLIDALTKLSPLDIDEQLNLAKRIDLDALKEQISKAKIKSLPALTGKLHDPMQSKARYGNLSERLETLIEFILRRSIDESRLMVEQNPRDLVRLKTVVDLMEDLSRYAPLTLRAELREVIDEATAQIEATDAFFTKLADEEEKSPVAASVPTEPIQSVFKPATPSAVVSETTAKESSFEKLVSQISTLWQSFITFSKTNIAFAQNLFVRSLTSIQQNLKTMRRNAVKALWQAGEAIRYWSTYRFYQFLYLIDNLKDMGLSALTASFEAFRKRSQLRHERHPTIQQLEPRFALSGLAAGIPGVDADIVVQPSPVEVGYEQPTLESVAVSFSLAGPVAVGSAMTEAFVRQRDATALPIGTVVVEGSSIVLTTDATNGSPVTTLQQLKSADGRNGFQIIRKDEEGFSFVTLRQFLEEGQLIDLSDQAYGGVSIDKEAETLRFRIYKEGHELIGIVIINDFNSPKPTVTLIFKGGGGGISSGGIGPIAFSQAAGGAVFFTSIGGSAQGGSSGSGYLSPIYIDFVSFAEKTADGQKDIEYVIGNYEFEIPNAPSSPLKSIKILRKGNKLLFKDNSGKLLFDYEFQPGNLKKEIGFELTEDGLKIEIRSPEGEVDASKVVEYSKFDEDADAPLNEVEQKLFPDYYTVEYSLGHGIVVKVRVQQQKMTDGRMVILYQEVTVEVNGIKIDIPDFFVDSSTVITAANIAQFIHYDATTGKITIDTITGKQVIDIPKADATPAIPSVDAVMSEEGVNIPLLEINVPLPEMGDASRNELRSVDMTRRELLRSAAMAALAAGLFGVGGEIANAQEAPSDSHLDDLLKRFNETQLDGVAAITKEEVVATVKGMMGQEFEIEYIRHSTEEDLARMIPDATERRSLIDTAARMMNDLGFPVPTSETLPENDTMTAIDWATQFLAPVILELDIRPKDREEFLKRFEKAIPATIAGLNFEKSLNQEKLFDMVVHVEKMGYSVAGLIDEKGNPSGDWRADVSTEPIQNFNEDSQVKEMYRPMVGNVAILNWVQLNKRWKALDMAEKTGLKMNLDTLLGVALNLAMQLDLSVELDSSEQEELDRRNRQRDRFFASIYLTGNHQLFKSPSMMSFVSLILKVTGERIDYGLFRFAGYEYVSRVGSWKGRLTQRLENLSHWLRGVGEAEKRAIFEYQEGVEDSRFSDGVSSLNLANGIGLAILQLSTLWKQKIIDSKTGRGPQSAAEVIETDDFDIFALVDWFLGYLNNPDTLPSAFQDLYSDSYDPTIKKIWTQLNEGTLPRDTFDPRVVFDIVIDGDKNKGPSKLSPDQQWDIHRLRKMADKLGTNPSADDRLYFRHQVLKVIIGHEMGRSMTWIRFGLEEGLIQIKRDAKTNKVTPDMTAFDARLKLMKQIKPYVEGFVGKPLNLNYTEDMGLLSGMAENVDRYLKHHRKAKEAVQDLDLRVKFYKAPVVEGKKDLEKLLAEAKRQLEKAELLEKESKKVIDRFSRVFSFILMAASKKEGIRTAAESMIADYEKISPELREPITAQYEQAKRLIAATQNIPKDSPLFMLQAGAQKILNLLGDDRPFNLLDLDSGSDQIGFMIGWILSLLKDWSDYGDKVQQLAEIINSVGRENIFREVEEYSKALDRALHQTPIPFADKFQDMVGGAQGRILSTLSDVGNESWDVWLKKKSILLEQFSQFEKDRGLLVRTLNEIHAKKSIEFGEEWLAANPRFTPEIVFKDPIAQGIVVSWLYSQATQNLDAERAEGLRLRSRARNELRVEPNEDVSLTEQATQGMNRRAFLRSTAAVTVVAATLAIPGSANAGTPPLLNEKDTPENRVATARQIIGQQDSAREALVPGVEVGQHGFIKNPERADSFGTAGQMRFVVMQQNPDQISATPKASQKHFDDLLFEVLKQKDSLGRYPYRDELLQDAVIIYYSYLGKPLTRGDVIKNFARYEKEYRENREIQGIFTGFGLSRIGEGETVAEAMEAWKSSRDLAGKIAYLILQKSFRDATLNFVEALLRREATIENSQNQAVLVGLAVDIARTYLKERSELTPEELAALVTKIKGMTKIAPKFIWGTRMGDVPIERVKSTEKNPFEGSKLKDIYYRLINQVGIVDGYALTHADRKAMGWVMGEIAIMSGLTGGPLTGGLEISENQATVIVDKRHEILEFATDIRNKKEAENLLNLIANQAPESNTLDLRDNSAHMGFLMNWSERKVYGGMTSDNYSTALYDNFKGLLESEVLMEYLQRIGFSDNFRVELANYYAEITKKTMKQPYDQDKVEKFYDLMGYLSFYAVSFNDITDFEKRLKKNLKVLDEIKNYGIEGQTEFDVIRQFYKNLKLPHPVTINGETVDNVADLNEVFYILKEKLKYQNKGRVWNETVEAEVRRGFRPFFTQMIGGVILNMTEFHDVSVKELLDTYKAIHADLSGYPIQREFNAGLEAKYFDFLQMVKTERVITDDNIINNDAVVEDLKNYFIYNQMIVAASQWFIRMHVKQPYDEKLLTLNDVRNKLDARKKTWELYATEWENIDVNQELINAGIQVTEDYESGSLASTPGQLTYIAELEWGNDKQREDFFVAGKRLYSLSRHHLGRRLTLDNLINEVTLYSQNKRIWLRTLGGRTNDLVDHMTGQKIGKKDQSTPDKLRRMLDHASIDDVRDLHTDSFTEKLRFVLTNFAKKTALIPLDRSFATSYSGDSYRGFLLDILGDDSDEERLRFIGLLDSVAKVSNDVDQTIFKRPESFEAAEILTDDGLREFVIRHLVNHEQARFLTEKEEAMTNDEFVDYVRENFRLTDVSKKDLMVLFEHRDHGGNFLTKENVKAIAHDSTILYDRIAKPDSFNVAIDKKKLFAMVVEESLNGNIPQLTNMKMNLTRYFMEQIHRKTTMDLLEQELESDATDQIESWIKENNLTAFIPATPWFEDLNAEDRRSFAQVLADYIANGNLDRQSVKRLLVDLRQVIEIFQKEKMTIMDGQNIVTPQRLRGLILLVDHARILGLERLGLVENPEIPINNARKKKIQETLDSARHFNAVRHVEDEIYYRFRMYSENYRAINGKDGVTGDTVTEIVSDLEADHAKENTEDALGFLGAIMAGVALWTGATINRSHLIYWNYRETTRRIRHIVTGKVVGYEKSHRRKVAFEATGVTSKHWIYFFGIALQLFVVGMLYWYVIDWANSQALVAIVANFLLYVRISWPLAQTVVERGFTFIKSVPHRRRKAVVAENPEVPGEIIKDKIPPHMKTITLIPSNNDGTKSVNDAILWRAALSAFSDLDEHTLNRVKEILAPYGLFERYRKHNWDEDGNPKLSNEKRYAVRQAIIEDAKKLVSDGTHETIMQELKALDINLAAVFHDTADRSEADMQSIRQTAQVIETVLGVRVHYFPRSAPSSFEKLKAPKGQEAADDMDWSINRNKKFGAIREMNHALTGGWFFPMTDNERYSDRELPYKLWPVAGFLSLLIIVPVAVLFGVATAFYVALVYGVLVLGIAFVLTGNTRKLQEWVEKKSVFKKGEVYADMTFYGFAHESYDVLLERQVKQLKEYYRQQSKDDAPLRAPMVDHPQILLPLIEAGAQIEDLVVWGDLDHAEMIKRYRQQREAFKVLHPGARDENNFIVDSSEILNKLVRQLGGKSEDYEIEPLMLKDENSSEFRRLYAAFIRDDKNHSGFQSDDDGQTIFWTGRELAIREAIRQGFVDRAERESKLLNSPTKRQAMAKKLGLSIEEIERRYKENAGMIESNFFKADTRALRQAEIIQKFIDRNDLILDERAAEYSTLNDIEAVINREGLQIEKQPGTVLDADKALDAAFGYVGDFSDTNSTFRQYLRNFPHYLPAIGALEVLQHKDNHMYGYANVHIEITGKSTDWMEQGSDAPMVGAAFAESKQTIADAEEARWVTRILRLLGYKGPPNRGMDNEYGKAVNVIFRTVFGVQSEGTRRFAGMYAMGTWIGILSGFLLGISIGFTVPFTLLSLSPGWIAGGIWAWGLMYVGGLIFGTFETQFLAGETGVLPPHALSHDNIQASMGYAINSVNSGVFEPTVKDIDEHQKRVRRWSLGEVFSKVFQFAPGSKLSSRMHHFAARRMFFAEVQFFLWILVVLVGSITWSGFVNTYAWFPYLLEFAAPGVAFGLLMYMFFSIVFLVNFASPLSQWTTKNRIKTWIFAVEAAVAHYVVATMLLVHPMVTFGLAAMPLVVAALLMFKTWGYSESLEKNRVSVFKRGFYVVTATIVYLPLIVTESISFVAAFWRAKIYGYEPMEDSSKIALLTKVTGALIGFLTIPILIYAPGFLSGFGSPLILTVAGYSLNFAFSGWIALPLLFLAINAGYKLHTTSLPLMGYLLAVGAAYFSPFSAPYIFMAILLGTFLAHRLSGRFATLTWFGTGLVGMAAMMAIPFSLSGAFNAPIIEFVVTQGSSLLGLMGFENIVLAKPAGFDSALNVALAGGLSSVLFYFTYQLFWMPGGFLKEPAPWGTFLASGLGNLKPLAFFSSKYRPAPFLALFLIVASAVTWTHQWGLVFTFPLIAAFTLAPYIMYKMGRNNRAEIFRVDNVVDQITAPLRNNVITKRVAEFIKNHQPIRLQNFYQSKVMWFPREVIIEPHKTLLNVALGLLVSIFYLLLLPFVNIANLILLLIHDTQEGWKLMKKANGIAKISALTSLIKFVSFHLGFLGGVFLLWGAIADIILFYAPSTWEPIIPSLTFISYFISSIVSTLVLPILVAYLLSLSPLLAIGLIWATVSYFLGLGFNYPFEGWNAWIYLLVSPYLWDLVSNMLVLNSGQTGKPGVISQTLSQFADFRRSISNFVFGLKNADGNFILDDQGRKQHVFQRTIPKHREKGIQPELVLKEGVDYEKLNPLRVEGPTRRNIVVGGVLGIIAVAMNVLGKQSPRQSGPSIPTKPDGITVPQQKQIVAEAPEEVRLREIEKKAIHAGLQYFRDDTSLLRLRLNETETFVMPMDRTNIFGKVHAFERDTRYTQPYVIGIWLNLLARQATGKVEKTVANPLKELDNVLSFLMEFQSRAKKGAIGWIQYRDGKLIEDPREIVGFEDIGQLATQIAVTIGVLQDTRDQLEDTAQIQQTDQLIEKLTTILDRLKPTFEEMIDSETGYMHAEFNVRTGKATGERLLRPNSESRGPLAFLAAYYNLNIKMFKPLNVGSYTDRNGKTYSVILTDDGGAFQHAFNLMNSSEASHPAFRRLHRNAVATYIDQWIRTRGKSFFPGAAYVHDSQKKRTVYEAALGARALSGVHTQVAEDVIVPHYALLFASIAPEVILPVYENVLQTSGLQNSHVGGLPLESLRDGRKASEHTALLAGSAVLSALDGENPSKFFDRFVASVNGMQGRINAFYEEITSQVPRGSLNDAPRIEIPANQIQTGSPAISEDSSRTRPRAELREKAAVALGVAPEVGEIKTKTRSELREALTDVEKLGEALKSKDEFAFAQTKQNITANLQEMADLGYTLDRALRENRTAMVKALGLNSAIVNGSGETLIRYREGVDSIEYLANMVTLLGALNVKVVIFADDDDQVSALRQALSTLKATNLSIKLLSELEAYLKEKASENYDLDKALQIVTDARLYKGQQKLIEEVLTTTAVELSQNNLILLGWDEQVKGIRPFTPFDQLLDKIVQTLKAEIKISQSA